MQIFHSGGTISRQPRTAQQDQQVWNTGKSENSTACLTRHDRYVNIVYLNYNLLIIVCKALHPHNPPFLVLDDLRAPCSL